MREREIERDRERERLNKQNTASFNGILAIFLMTWADT